MATGEEHEEIYPVIKDVRSLHETNHGIKQQERISQGRYSANGKMFSCNSKKTVPQRPEDLLNVVSLDMAQVNVRSSSQYRKSYAFKIWRERGSFPYRIAEQPVRSMMRQKKSKKFVNSSRVQEDKEKEEAWKAFKSSRNKEDTKHRMPKFPRVRVEGTSLARRNQEKIDTVLSRGRDAKSSEAGQQNSIPDYFRNRKDSTTKYVASNFPAKAIPTSVIYINTTKSCQMPQQISEAEQSMGTRERDVDAHSVVKTQATSNATIAQRETSKSSNKNSRENLLPENKDCSIFQWSDSQPSSVANGNIHGQDPDFLLNNNTLIDAQKIPATTENNTNILGRQSPSISHASQSLSGTSYSLPANTAAKSREGGGTISERLHVPSPVSEEAHPEMDSSHLALIIKNSLANKYSKENVKPNSTSRRRKRASNELLGSGEGERRNTKQQKTTMFTRLDETVATNLADGIHNVNSEYFPIEALANKAAKETSNGGPGVEGKKSQITNTFMKHKVNEIERAR